MRPLRLLLTCASAIFGILFLSYLVTARSRRIGATLQRDPAYSSPLSWSSPSSLFPPSAVISLTDDNSTFFLARPASFGPALPLTGLTGQLWVGVGFGDDKLGNPADGELGCSDVPGWSDKQHTRAPSSVRLESLHHLDTAPRMADIDTTHKPKRNADTSDESTTGHVNVDGTDNYLHQLLSSSSEATDRSTIHADIQSIQESAEIAGKVVMLTRGGCGFLEKVKWVQRRGGTALIVGDNVRGGALITMYAREDTSNVTIPSLFTSYTTAHLLSSLMPAGGSMADLVQTLQSRVGHDTRNRLDPAGSEDRRDSSHMPDWFHWFVRSANAGHDSRRPPSSGNLDHPQPLRSTGTTSSATSTPVRTSVSASKTTTDLSDDAFVIGVHDWRDPDLVMVQTDKTLLKHESLPTLNADLLADSGSITPGSGDYGPVTAKAKGDANGIAIANAQVKTGRYETSHVEPAGDGRSWFGWLSLDRKNVEHEHRHDGHDHSTPDDRPRPPANGRHDPAHEGLWITLQPTSVSSSPFFDALLVLVVSPLVTLSVVYALLLLRARLRRRRWRAPKSVVEQLPVRTYQTIASATTSGHSSRGSPTLRPSSPTLTTPLLASAARPIFPRARSRTESQVVAGASVSASVAGSNGFGMSASSFGSLAEKREHALAEWRRKYRGRQRECVVCLEEYIDGVSKVMSLPCGHEFHAECITPWLTTRRRTCPICKGDVVRSLARANVASSLGANETLSRLYEHEEEDYEDAPGRVDRHVDEHEHEHEHEHGNGNGNGNGHEAGNGHEHESNEHEGRSLDLERGIDRTR